MNKLQFYSFYSPPNKGGGSKLVTQAARRYTARRWESRRRAATTVGTWIYHSCVFLFKSCASRAESHRVHCSVLQQGRTNGASAHSMRLHPAHGADELTAPSHSMLVSLSRSAAARMTPVHLRMCWAMLSCCGASMCTLSLCALCTGSRRYPVERPLKAAHWISH